MQMKITKWFSKDECKANNEEFVKRFQKKDLDGAKDVELFYSALWGAAYLSQEADDEDKMELWENLADDIEEYKSIIYLLRVRDGGGSHILALKPNELKYGQYEGEYDPESPEIAEYKHKVWMEWSPATQLQVMEGNPNTDAQFMSGSLKVIGSTKLASLPRNMIYDFFYFNEIEID